MGNEISRTCGFDTPSAETLDLPGAGAPVVTISSYSDIAESDSWSVNETKRNDVGSASASHHHQDPHHLLSPSHLRNESNGTHNHNHNIKKALSSPPRLRPNQHGIAHLRSPLKKKPPTSPMKDSIIRRLSAKADEFESDSDAVFSVPALLPQHQPSPLSLLEETLNYSMMSLDDRENDSSSNDEQRSALEQQNQNNHLPPRYRLQKSDFAPLLQLIEWERYYVNIDAIEDTDGKVYISVSLFLCMHTQQHIHTIS